jgi:hypothetical protein
MGDRVRKTSPDDRKIGGLSSPTFVEGPPSHILGEGRNLHVGHMQGRGVDPCGYRARWGKKWSRGSHFVVSDGMRH